MSEKGLRKWWQPAKMTATMPAGRAGQGQPAALREEVEEDGGDHCDDMMDVGGDKPASVGLNQHKF